MVSTHADVVGYPNVAVLSSSDLQCLLSIGVYDIEALLSIVTQGLEDNEILFRSLNLYDVDYLVVVSYLERKYLLAQFAIQLLELNDDLSLVDLHRLLGFKPTLQAFEMNLADSSSAVTRRDQGIKFFQGLSPFLFFSPTDLAGNCRLVRHVVFIFLILEVFMELS